MCTTCRSSCGIDLFLLLPLLLLWSSISFRYAYSSSFFLHYLLFFILLPLPFLWTSFFFFFFPLPSSLSFFFSSFFSPSSVSMLVLTICIGTVWDQYGFQYEFGFSFTCVENMIHMAATPTMNDLRILIYWLTSHSSFNVFWISSLVIAPIYDILSLWTFWRICKVTRLL